MIRFVMAAALLLAAASPVLAEGAQPKKPNADLSRSVTLTGHELQALIKAQVAAAEAQSAAQAASEAIGKVNAALTVAPEPPANPEK
jgi:hypothetical protein